MTQNDNVIAIPRFLGIRNASTRRRLPFGSLKAADNIVLDGTGTIERRDGFSRDIAATRITDAWGDRYFGYTLMVDDGALKRVDPDGASTVLADGLTEKSFQWAQTEDCIAFAGRDECGQVLGGELGLSLRLPHPGPPTVARIAGSLPAGRYQFAQVWRDLATGLESGLSVPVMSEFATPGGFALSAGNMPAGYVADIYATAANSSSLRYFGSLRGATAHYVIDAALADPVEEALVNAKPFPRNVTALAFHDSRLWAAIYNDTQNMGVVNRSRPLQYHLFGYGLDSIAVQGRVLGMASLQEGLFVATTTNLWLIGPDDSISKIADYGAVPGRPIAWDQDGNAFCWTLRGLCALSPFQNLYQDGAFGWKLSVAPGSQCSAAVIPYHGTTLAPVLTDGGGRAYNPYPS